MDMEEMRRNWKKMELRINKIETENHRLVEQLKKSRACSAKRKLTIGNGVMTVFCAVSPLWIVLLSGMVDVSFALYLSYIIFFVIMTLVTGRVWLWLLKTDYMLMSVKEALICAYKTKRLNRDKELVGYLTGLPLIAFLMIEVYQMGIDELMVGAWIGLVIGGIVGICIRIRDNRLLKNMRQALEEEVFDDKDAIDE